MFRYYQDHFRWPPTSLSQMMDRMAHWAFHLLPVQMNPLVADWG